MVFATVLIFWCFKRYIEQFHKKIIPMVCEIRMKWVKCSNPMMPRNTSGSGKFSMELPKKWSKCLERIFFIRYFHFHITLFGKFYLKNESISHFCFAYSQRLFTSSSTKLTNISLHCSTMILTYLIFLYLLTFDHFENWTLNEYSNGLWHCLIYTLKQSFFFSFLETDTEAQIRILVITM